MRAMARVRKNERQYHDHWDLLLDHAARMYKILAIDLAVHQAEQRKFALWLATIIGSLQVSFVYVLQFGESTDLCCGLSSLIVPKPIMEFWFFWSVSVLFLLIGLGYAVLATVRKPRGKLPYNFDFLANEATSSQNKHFDISAVKKGLLKDLTEAVEFEFKMSNTGGLLNLYARRWIAASGFTFVVSLLVYFF